MAKKTMKPEPKKVEDKEVIELPSNNKVHLKHETKGLNISSVKKPVENSSTKKTVAE